MSSEATTLNSLGIVYANRGKYDKAVECYAKSLAMQKALKDTSGAASTLHNLANVYRAWGQYDKAVKYYEQSLAISIDLNSERSEAASLVGLGAVYDEWGRSDKAAQYFEEALSISRKLKDLSGEVSALTSLGIIYNGWGQHDKAVQYYEKCLAISRDLEDPRGEATALKSLGEVYDGWGQRDKAAEYFEHALSISRKFKDLRGESSALNSLGNVYHGWGRYDKALEYYEKALAIKRDLRDPTGEATILHNLGNVHKDWGKHDKALEYYEKSLAISRSHQYAHGEAMTLNSLGIIYDSTGQYEKAEQSYQKALTIGRQLKDPDQEVSTINNLGLLFDHWGQYEKAVEYYDNSLAISRQLKDLKHEATALNNLGAVYRNWGLYDKAEESYQKSLAINRQLKDPEGEAIGLINLGIVYEKTGQYNKAVENQEKAIAINRQLKDPRIEAAAVKCLGQVHFEWSQYSKAVEYYGKSLVINRQLKDPMGEASTLSHLGIVYDTWGKYDKASEYYERSLTIYQQLKNPDGEASVLMNLGVVHRSRGQYSKALEYFEKSLVINRQLKNPEGEAIGLSNMGDTYRAWGRYVEALENFEKSLAIRRQLKDPKGEASSLTDIGLVYCDWGQYDRAIENYEQALKVRQRLKDREGEAASLLNIGWAYAQLERFDEALPLTQKGAHIYEEIGVPTRGAKQDIGDLYLNMGQLDKAEPFLQAAGYWAPLGRLHLLKSDFTGAIGYYEKVLQASKKNRDVRDLFAAYTGLGLAYEGLGNEVMAGDYFDKAVNLTEELRTGLNEDQRAKFFEAKVLGFLRTAPYDGLARVRAKQDRGAEAFKTSEYTKARVFAESMSRRSDTGSFDIPKELLMRDRELTDQLAALKKKRQEAYEKSNQEVIAAVEPQVKEMEVKLDAHIQMLREKYPLFAATKYPEPMGIDQTALKNNEWTLACHVTDLGIIIYLTKGKNIVKALFKPIPRDKLNGLVLKFRKPLEIVPGKDNFDEKLKSFDLVTGKKLSDLLLSDVLESIPGHVPILVIPDDCLGMMPFEMLVLNDKGVIKTDKSLPYVSGAEFFGDRNLISYSQSVTALTLSRIYAKARGTQTGLLAIADPVFDEKDERTSKAPKKDAPTGVMASLYKRLGLMAAEESDQMGGLKFSRLKLTGELAKALSEMRKQGSAVYTGFNASKSNFMNKIAPKLNQYDEVLFATHGYFGKDLPGIMEPVLVLTLVPPGTDGFLRMTEVIGLNMNAEIVALTACQTGLGKRTAGEGTMGMGRAFQYAGAKSVLMSLWSVSEVASVNLVKSFFRNMKEGKGKSEALASARTEIRGKGFDQPFFWAGFILVGETN